MRFKRALLVSTLLAIQLVTPIILDIQLISKVRAATGTYTAVADTFTSTSTSNPANGDRRFMPIGTYYDPTIGATFSRSRALIKFSNISLPSNAIIKSAKIQVWHYGTNSNNQPLYVSRVTSGWNESTVYPGPSHSGDYGSTTFPYYNSNSQAQLREISVNTSLIGALQSSNNGVVIRNYDETARGVVICASEIPSGPCKSGMQPKLVVNYELNQTPTQPNLDRPQSNWELGPRTNGSYTGITCNESGTGLGCDVQFRASTDDPDNTLPLNNTYQIRSTEGGNQDYSYTGEGWNTWTKPLNDGHWNWRGRSIDLYGANSGWTGYRNFVVDTTVPSESTMTEEPEYSTNLQNETNSSESLDGLIGGVQYEYQRAEDPDFTIGLETSGWIDINGYIFASLAEEVEYFYRVRARDGLWNTTNWSVPTSSIQDATFPIIDNLIIDNLRISPANQDGILDTSIIASDFLDLHLSTATVEIYDWNGTLVLDYSDDTLIETGDTLNFTWDGKDSVGNYVSDGSYNIVLKVLDKAGNETIDDTNWVIIDNEPADLNFNTANGVWFNYSPVEISGQTEPDASLRISNTQSSQLIDAILDGVGKFTESLNLELGLNQIEFKATDQTGNDNIQNVEYFREEVAPSIDITSPQNLTNEQQFTINLNLNDSGYNDYISGVDVSTLNLSLSHPDIGDLVLVENGVNIEGGNVIENCSTNSGIYGNSKPASCSYNYTLGTPLQPDGDWEIKASVYDIAGNVSQIVNNTFELDSHILNEVSEPNNGQLFNYSQITLRGSAEKGSKMVVSVDDSNGDGVTDEETFDIIEQQNGRLTVGNCRASSNPTQDGIKEICDWEISNFQLERDLLDPGNITNNISFNLTDAAGNIDSQMIAVDVDVYAVNLNIDSNLEYFSPNGDGRQDGVDFTNMSTDGQLGDWEIRIDDILGERIKTLSGQVSLPESIGWDGRDDFGQFISDGDYTYYLFIRTTDGIEFTTTPQTITAVTQLSENVIITNPKNGSFTTSGVIEVQGQGPTNTIVRICDNVVGLPAECDFEYEAEVNSFSSFSHVVPLYRLPDQANTEHFLSARAYDKYGNETEESNIVKITVTNNSPFKSIEILPAFTGVNNEDDYQIIVDKLNSGEEITQADIDSLRSVIFRSTVNQGTERVKFSFVEHTNLENLPEELQFNNIGWIDNSNSTHLYQEFEDGVTAYNQCNTPECTWDFYYPVPPIGGALYEIKFDGKLGEDIEEQTVALNIDGNIPTSPMILDIDKIVDGKSFNTNIYENKYYSNSEIIEIKGLADPGAAIVVDDVNSTANCSTTSNGIGFWSCQINSNGPELQLGVTAALGENLSSSLEDKYVIIDTTNPEYVSLDTLKEWYQSGNIIEISTETNEKLAYSKTITGSGIGCINDDLDPAIYDHNLTNNLTGSTGSHTIPGIAQEGRFCLTSEIQDLAGNRNSQEMIVFIDNTAPLIPTISTDNWGKYNGIETKPGYIAKGRLVPEFVHEENSIKINGFGELGQSAELFINGSSVQSITIKNDIECFANNDEVISDGVTTLSQYFCPYSFSYTFADGESDYQIQVKMTDQGGNQSIISEDEIVYLDQTTPETPETINVSANGQSIVDWQFAKNQEIVTSKLGTGNLGKLPITNQKKIEIEDYAESRSDFVHKVSKGSTLLTNGFIQKSDDGKDVRDQALNKGDGIYTFTSSSTDAAGNSSLIHKFEIELDTVPPKAPTVGEPFLCGNSICINASGENGADLVINGSKIAKVSSTSKQFVLKSGWDYLTTYTFNIKLMDRATNSSQTVTKSITTPGGVGDGGYEDILGTATDPWDSAGIAWFNAVKFKTIINPDGSYEIKDIFMLFPHLTYATTNSNGVVDIYGIGIPSGYNIETEIQRNYMTYNEAKNSCNAGWWINEQEEKCMEEEMGIESLDKWNSSNWTDCLGSPVCINNRKKNKREVNYEDKEYKVDHSMIAFHKNIEGNSQIGYLWNGDKKGRFKKSFTLGKEVNTGDKVKARVQIFGEFEYDGFRIDYRGATPEEAQQNGGMCSKWSNEKEITSAKQQDAPFYKDITSVVKKGATKITQNAFGKYSHVDNPAIDIAAKADSPIKATISGTAYYRKAGELILQNSQANYVVSYYHVSAKTNELLSLGSKKSVQKGDTIAYVGDVGAKNAFHVHYQVNHKTIPMPVKADCNKPSWVNWRNHYIEILKSLNIPYDTIHYYDQYMGMSLYNNQGKSINSKSVCPQY